MKACFFGMGSIGSRHAHTLKSWAERTERRVETHAFRSSKGAPESGDIDRNIEEWAALEPPYDLLFITNPTALHYDTLQKTAGLAKTYFVEKPLFHTSSLPTNFLDAFKGKTTYVACPMRFHPVIEQLKQRGAQGVVGARVLCSSYLPEWRKGRDYRTVYSARRELGGGAALDLIHELDYVRFLFGDPVRSVRAAGKFSSLEIDSDDMAAFILSYPERVVEVHLDYFGRVPRREIELFCEEDVLVGDLLRNTLTSLVSGERTVFPKEGIYEKEMEYFLAKAEAGEETFNSFQSSLETLRLAEGGESR